MRPRVSFAPVLSLSVLLACSGDEGGAATDTRGSDTGDASTDAPTSGTTGDAADTTGGSTDDATSAATSDATTSDDTTSATGVDPTTGSTSDDTTSSTGDGTTSSTGDDTTGSTGDDTGAPGPLMCPMSIDQAILTCIDELQADPDLAPGNFLIDLLFTCSDAEPVADDYDAHCALVPDDPVCALEYAEFVASVLPECVARAQQLVFADVCLLPSVYGELLFTPAIALMERRFVTSAAELDAGEVAQVLWASADIGFPAATVEEALLATDDDGMEQLTVLDVGTDRTIVSFSGHYGDTRVGRLFLRDTLTLVGAIEDGELTRCGVERTVEGQPCAEDLACEPVHSCLDVLLDADDVVLAPGVCIAPGALPGEGDACSAHGDCDPTSGLLCLDTISEGEPGTCRPGWMRRSFAGPDAALVPGGILEIPLLVAGLATVPTGAYLDLQLFQDSVNELEIRLTNPTGTSSLVSATDAPLIQLDLTPVPVPGDESAGGIWYLTVEDVGGQASGSITRLALTLDTRWD